MTNDEYRIYLATRIGGRYMGTDGPMSTAVATRWRVSRWRA